MNFVDLCDAADYRIITQTSYYKRELPDKQNNVHTLN